MTPEEFEEYKLTKPMDLAPYVYADFFPFDSGTILYGYTIDRYTFHVYKKDRAIHRYVYDFNGFEVVHDCGHAMRMEFMIPSKRTYPDQTLFSFAMHCRKHNISIPFTSPSNRDSVLVPGEFTKGARLYDE